MQQGKQGLLGQELLCLGLLLWDFTFSLAVQLPF